MNSDDEKYILTSTNPNEQKEPFVISKNEMQFNTNSFYEYVFSDITVEMEVEIIDKSREDDKAAKRVYSIISEILNEIGISRFNEDDMNLEAHKILKRIASGIHWKDLAKYNYLRNRMQKTSENKTMSEREKNYIDVVNLVFEKIFGNGVQIEDTKNRFIKKLIEKKVEKAKILEFFKISEENLKKIIG